MSKEYIKLLLSSDFHLYYSTPHLNDCIYLHYKGYIKLENLDELTGLKVIYAEGNCIEWIENLDNNINLCCIYL